MFNIWGQENYYCVSAKALNSLAMGGIGGTGADSGDVTVTHTGTINVRGDNSYGIYAQSVSGGGGSMGYSIGNPVSSFAATGLQLAIGATQSKGQAGKVTLNITGDINVTGNNSHAFFQQSVNGGGGSVNTFMDLTESAAALSEDSAVVPENLGVKEHFTNMATDIVMSLGGKQVVDAYGSAVDYVQNGNIFGIGGSSSGSSVQTVGGGGGQSHIDISLYEQQTATTNTGLGGSENQNSSGGNVNGARTGDISMQGNQTTGSSVQTIGGGGGVSVVNFSKTADPDALPVASLVVAGPLAAVTTPQYVTVNSQLGADGGSGNHGGSVVSNITGLVATSGDRSVGVLRQSIGAGGGVQYLTGADGVATSIGAMNNGSGNGGAIALNHTGDVFTDGIQSHGVVLQSIGGGGGLQLSDAVAANVTLTQNTANTGNGAAIALTQDGNVTTTGANTTAIIAQSLGGGGGVVDRLFADTAGGNGSSDAVTLNLNGSVRALGDDSVAVLAQSRGKDGQGNISIELAADQVIAAGTNGVGVHISGGKTNSLVNRGSMMTTDGLSGSVINAEEGDDTVDNHNLFYGQFALGAGVNQFNNKLGAMSVLGETQSLGLATNRFTNEGEMMLGDMGLAQRTDLEGSFTQAASGKNYMELDFNTVDRTTTGGTNDRMYLTGSASLAGEMEISMLNAHLIPSGRFLLELFSADQGVADDGMFLDTIPSVVVSYNLVYPTSNLAALDLNVDFAVAGGGMSQNLVEVGEYFNRVQNVGGTPELGDTVMTLINIPDMDLYRHALTQLSPDIYGEVQSDLVHRSDRFARALIDGGDYHFDAKDSKFWFAYETERTQRDQHWDYKQFYKKTNKVILGVERELVENWTWGVGASEENHETEGYFGNWESEGHTKQLGVYVKRALNGLEISGTLSRAWTDSDVTRIGNLTHAFEATSERKLKSLTGSLSVSKVHQKGMSYFRPLGSIGFTKLDIDGTEESGAGVHDLLLTDHDEIHMWTRLGIDAGHTFTVDHGTQLKVYGRLGLQYYLTGDETTTIASLRGGPEGIDPMEVGIDINGMNGYGALGIDIIHPSNITFGVEYSTIFERNSSIDRFNLRARIPF